METTEIWVPIVGHENYQVSNLGRVRRADTLALKKVTINGSGYPVVNLWARNQGAVRYVHDLVAVAFIGPKPKGLCVNHLDGVKANNIPANLEYVSLAENNGHAQRMGLSARGETMGNAKLSNAQAAEIRRRARAGERGCDLAREFGVGQPIVSQIKTGTRWGHLADA